VFGKGLGRGVSILAAAGLLAAGAFMASGGALLLTERAGWGLEDRLRGSLPQSAMDILASAQQHVASAAKLFSASIGPDAALYEASIAAAGFLICVALLLMLAAFFFPYTNRAQERRS